MGLEVELKSFTLSASDGGDGYSQIYLITCDRSDCKHRDVNGECCGDYFGRYIQSNVEIKMLGSKLICKSFSKIEE